MKGAYVLIIKLDSDKEIQIGKLGKLFFKKGFYSYIGSAMNSLEGRIKRHLNPDKKLHWHIDYLLKHSKIINVFYTESQDRIECDIAKKFSKKLESIEDFGCSDCKCKSHLFCRSYSEIKNCCSSSNLILYKNKTCKTLRHKELY